MKKKDKLQEALFEKRPLIVRALRGSEIRKKIGIARYAIDSDGFVLEMIERIM